MSSSLYSQYEVALGTTYTLTNIDKLAASTAEEKEEENDDTVQQNYKKTTDEIREGLKKPEGEAR